MKHLIYTLVLTTALPVAAFAADAGMTSLFDGKSLDGWEVRSGSATYKVEDGAIVGTTVEGSPNTFLCTKREFGDFVLEFEVRCDPDLNSGVQFRSAAAPKDGGIEFGGTKKKLPPGRVYGYQAEIATANAGRVYDEARRGIWVDPGQLPPEEAAQKAAQSSAASKAAYKPEGWNHCRVVAQGDRIQTFVNGVKITDFRDSVAARGFIGLQVHGIKAGAGPFSVRWRNLRLRELAPGETP